MSCQGPIRQVRTASVPTIHSIHPSIPSITAVHRPSRHPTQHHLPATSPLPPRRTRKGRLYGVDVLGGGAPRDLQDAIQLVHGGGAREDGLAVDQLTQDAACSSSKGSSSRRCQEGQGMWVDG